MERSIILERADHTCPYCGGKNVYHRIGVDAPVEKDREYVCTICEANFSSTLLHQYDALMAEIAPTSCKECNCSQAYTSGPYVRNPHYCCELIWKLFNCDYKVDPDEVDENCPYRDSGFMAYVIRSKMSGEFYE